MGMTDSQESAILDIRSGVWGWLLASIPSMKPKNVERVARQVQQRRNPSSLWVTTLPVILPPRNCIPKDRGKMVRNYVCVTLTKEVDFSRRPKHKPRAL
jgi:hypothetical protein